MYRVRGRGALVSMMHRARALSAAFAQNPGAHIVFILTYALITVRQKWTGVFFDKTSLCDLGLCVHLGHNGSPCPNPSFRKNKFVVCDITGFHHIDLQFCGCYDTAIGIVHSWKQLLRARWYPASQARPATAFTFRLLDFFYELTHQSKGTLYDFHKTIDCITDNSGTVAGWVRCAQVCYARI